MIDGRDMFHQTKQKNVSKMIPIYGGNYTTGCLLDYSYLKKYLI